MAAMLDRSALRASMALALQKSTYGDTTCQQGVAKSVGSDACESKISDARESKIRDACQSKISDARESKISDATDECSGKALFASGKFLEASKDFERSIAADPEDAALRANLALCYLKLGNYAAALEHADFALKKLDLTEKIALYRKLNFRRALAREGLLQDDETDVEDLRRVATAYEAEGKAAEAQAAWEVFHRLRKTQRIRQLKDAARAEGWAIDSPREEARPHPAIDSNSDYYRVWLPEEDREIKTLRVHDTVTPLPAVVEERLRKTQAEEVTLNGRDASVRPMGEPVSEWDPEHPELVGEEKAFEPQLKMFAEFQDLSRWKEELRQRWIKFG